jgi:hypothetical protein
MAEQNHSIASILGIVLCPAKGGYRISRFSTFLARPEPNSASWRKIFTVSDALSD